MSRVISVLVVALLSGAIVANSQYAWRQSTGRVANFGEACSQSADQDGIQTDDGLPCDFSKNLTCSANNFCECKEETNEDGVLNTFVANSDPSTGCSIPLQAKQINADLSRCLTSSQCHDSRYGFLSRCNENSRCECYDSLTGGQKRVVLVDRVCQYFQNFGDPCTSDRECNGTITGEAVCKAVNPNSSQKTCACHDDFVWDNNLQECLRIYDSNWDHECRSSLQCSHPIALGFLARCEDRKCQCFDINSNGKVETGIHPRLGKCVRKRKIREMCDASEECELGASHLAVCKEGMLLKMCQCQDGYVWGPAAEVDKEDCLPIGSYHSQCTADQQCSHPEGLGKLSTCAKIVGGNNPRLGHCECFDAANGGAQEVGHHEGKCYYKRKANETCELNQECMVGYHKNAICTEQLSFNSLKVCTCPPNTKCSSATGLLPSFGVVLFLFVSYTSSKTSYFFSL